MTREKSNDYHRPVLVDQVAAHLVSDPNGAYLDLTAGGGGHLKALAEATGDAARLYGFDRDRDAVDAVRESLRETKKFKKIEQGTFDSIGSRVDEFEDQTFSGILLDLGVSSHQIDRSERGFSFQEDGPLDMRMDISAGEPAASLIGRLDARELATLLREYGEERQSARIARTIVMERRERGITTTTQLAEIVRSVVGERHTIKSLARVFQALRIAVNDEIGQLRRVLPVARDLLVSGGRLAVISYHSLEDREVKRFFRNEARPRCTCPPGLPVCQCGATQTMRLVTARPITPTAGEQASNPRSRSAKLRVGEKL